MRILPLLLLLTACASVTPVTRTGPNAYVVAAEGGFGAFSPGVQVVNAQKKADAFCQKMGKTANTIKVEKRAGAMGRNVASATINFRCE